MSDASHVKTHRIAANGVTKTRRANGASARPKAGESRRHLVCDGGGRPVHLGLTAGNRADISQARQCLEPYVTKGCTVIADRGYDANHLRDWWNKRDAIACIPPRKNRKVQCAYDTELSGQDPLNLHRQRRFHEISVVCAAQAAEMT